MWALSLRIRDAKTASPIFGSKDVRLRRRRQTYIASRKRGNKIAVCSWKTEVILRSNVL
jgi:hypothetical protein